jgi:hypothetical protein
MSKPKKPLRHTPEEERDIPKPHAKPIKLDMPAEEALARLVRVPPSAIPPMPKGMIRSADGRRWVPKAKGSPAKTKKK